MHTSNSYFHLFKGQILEILKTGLDVVSTSQGLSFPRLAHPKEAAKIDAAAKKAGKTLLATGVNPGFLMDSLPLFLTASSERVERNSSERPSAEILFDHGLNLPGFYTVVHQDHTGIAIGFVAILA